MSEFDIRKLNFNALGKFFVPFLSLYPSKWQSLVELVAKDKLYACHLACVFLIRQ